MVPTRVSLRSCATLTILCGVLIATPAAAEEGRRALAEVRVQGNRRAEAEAVLSVTRSKVGEPLDRREVSEDIRRIYSLGYFKDIQVDLTPGPKGPVLTYIVAEKPAIREIRYEGLDELAEDDVQEVVDLRPYSVLNISDIKRNAQKIKDLYTEKGFFLADVEFRLKQLSEHEVDVVFLVNEHAKVQVTRITILGNRAISDSELKENIATRERSFLSFLTQEGNFKREVFERDLMLLRAYYMNHGYVNVKVTSPVVTLAPDKEHIDISIHVVEGKQYRIREIEISGDLLGPKEEIEALVRVKPGEVFNQRKVFLDLERVGQFYKDKGYAFANVNPLTKTNDQDLTVDLNLRIQKGNLVHFGRVEIVGHNKTRDKVIRRELRLYEGDLYSETGIKLSKRNVTRLGFFETVEITTKRGAKGDEVDVTVQVKERQTGTFQIGAGLSTYESIIGTVQISQNNLLGRGQSFSVMGTLSSVRQYINLHFSEPHFLDTDWLLSFDLFKYEYQFTDFVTGSNGGSATLGYQLTDDLRVFFSYELAWKHYEQVRGMDSDDGRTSSVTAKVAWDTRDDRFLPSSGWYVFLSEEMAHAGLMSEKEFAKTNFSARYYHPLFWKFVAMAKMDYGFVRRPSRGIRTLGGLVDSEDDEDVPLFERFWLGGIQSVRGFRHNSLGIPADYLTDPMGLSRDTVTGGTEKVQLNFEITFPLFEQVGIRGVVFHDMGMVYDENGTILADPDALWGGLRASWGFGFRWFSPIGPLRFEWGFPYNPKQGEDGQLFEFTIGNF